MAARKALSRVRIGMAGYGGIGRVHALGYRSLPIIYPNTVPEPVLSRVATSRRETARRAQLEAGFANTEDSVLALAHADDVDVLDVTLPNHLHADVVIAALEEGKPVYCEKPLAHSVEEARRIADRAEASGTPVGMVFQYRFSPAIQRAREIIAAGALGRLFTYRAEYLHAGYQDPERPMSWRLKREEGGSGALGDLGSHIIDLVRYLVGEFQSVQGHLETFIPERPTGKGSDIREPVTVDDVAWIRARMHNGALGTLEASRFATGTLDDLRIWIYGQHGALHFDLMNPSFLFYYDDTRPSGGFGGERGWQRLDTVAQYPESSAPPGRAPVGWSRFHAESQYRFLQAIAEGRTPEPGIRDGLRAQLVMDAVQRSAASNGSWTAVDADS